MMMMMNPKVKKCENQSTFGEIMGNSGCLVFLLTTFLKSFEIIYCRNRGRTSNKDGNARRRDSL